MKKKMFVSLLMVVLLVGLALTGCGPEKVEDADQVGPVNHELTVGIVQFDEHPALDDARLGFEEGLKELGVKLDIQYQNAQREIPTSVTISEKFVKDGVDLIYAIATPSAQTAKQATDEIPVLFSAVTAPVEDGLVDSMEKPGGNVTGTSDEAPIDRQLQIFKDLDPTIEKIGIIFNTSEPNSQVQVDIAEQVAQDIGLEIVPVGISNINDVPQAVDSILKKVDGIYTITDNMVASAINVVAKKAMESGVITVGAEESHIAGGILMTDGLSYFELGKQTAQMAYDILFQGKSPADIPSAKATTTKKVFNEETLKTLNLDENHKVFEGAEKFDQ